MLKSKKKDMNNNKDEEKDIHQVKKSIMKDTLKNLKKIREMLDLTDLKQTA